MLNNKTKLTLVLLFLLTAANFGFFSGPRPVLAQNSSESMVVIEPAKFDLYASPETTIKKSFSIINRSNLALKLKVETKGFKILDSGGKIEFYDTGDNGMSKWLVPEFLEISLKPLESRDIQFFVVVPKEVQSQGYYGAILLSNADPATRGLKSPIGTLVLLTVAGGSGKASVGSEITSFSATNFSFGGPVKFELKLKNDGNTHLVSSGNIRVLNWLGKEIKNFKTGDLTVYPETTKKFAWNWTKAPLFGFYKAEIQLTNVKKDEQKNNAAAWFVVFSWKMILIVLAALAIIAFVIYRFRKKLFGR